MFSKISPLLPSYVTRLICRQSGLKATRSHSLRVASISRKAVAVWGDGATAAPDAADVGVGADDDVNTDADAGIAVDSDVAAAGGG